MNNIKQIFTKLIISFFCFAIIGACGSTKNANIDKNTTIAPIEVAILVPLSGEYALIGKEYAKLIKSGLADGAKTSIKVTSYDCADEITLKESIQKIFEQKTNIIIGPIYSKDTKILSAQMKNRDIVVLSLSNDPTLADSNVYVFGHAPMKQMEQITNYLLNNDYKNYITLLPLGKHSQTVGQIIRSMIINKEATLNRMEFYSNNDESITKAIHIVSDTVDNLNEQDENLTKPVIIIGDDQENLKKIYQIAHKFNLDKKAVIAGDNRLDADSSEPFDIVYTGSIKIDNIDFKNKITALGITNFSFMHALVYDAGKIVADCITNDYSIGKFLANINASGKFQGLSGKITFIDSIAVREYEIIKKQHGVYSVLSDQIANGKESTETIKEEINPKPAN